MVPRGGVRGGRVIEAVARTERPGNEGADRVRRSRGGLVGSALLIAKPGIAGGVALTALAGMTLAGRGIPGPGEAILCLGAVIAAACGAAVANGLLDAPIDARMPRLARRTAALDRVGRRGAAALSLILVLLGLFLAFRHLNAVAGLLVLAAVLSYTVPYTLWLKRRSPHGTIPGGIPGAMPALIGYAATDGRIGLDGVILFAIFMLWQPPHFWALALSCQDDYRAAGVPVLPVSFGEPYTRTALFIYAVALLPVSLALWVFGYCSGAYAAAALLLWSGFILSCYLNAVASRRYGRAFGASILYIFGLLAAVIADVAFRFAL